MARVCIISQSHYPYDSRVSRQARALVRAGHEVDVICLQFEDQRFFERAEGVSVFRLPIGRLRGGKLRYLFEFAAFQLPATVLAGALHLRNRYEPERSLGAAPRRGFTLICHGTIEPNYGLDLVVRAVGLLRERIPSLRLEIWGDGTHRPAVEALTIELGLEDRVRFSGWVTM